MTIPETNKFPFIYFGNRPVFVFMTRNTQVPQKKFFAGLLMGLKKTVCCGTSLGLSIALGTVWSALPHMIGLWQSSMHEQ